MDRQQHQTNIRPVTQSRFFLFVLYDKIRRGHWQLIFLSLTETQSAGHHQSDFITAFGERHVSFIFSALFKLRWLATEVNHHILLPAPNCIVSLLTLVCEKHEVTHFQLLAPLPFHIICGATCLLVCNGWRDVLFHIPVAPTVCSLVFSVQVCLLQIQTAASKQTPAFDECFSFFYFFFTSTHDAIWLFPLCFLWFWLSSAFPFDIHYKNLFLFKSLAQSKYMKVSFFIEMS